MRHDPSLETTELRQLGSTLCRFHHRGGISPRLNATEKYIGKRRYSSTEILVLFLSSVIETAVKRSMEALGVQHATSFTVNEWINMSVMQADSCGCLVVVVVAVLGLNREVKRKGI